MNRSQGNAPLSRQQRARRVADAAWAAERATKWFRLGLDAVGAGQAAMSMSVEAHHLNAYGGAQIEED